MGQRVRTLERQDAAALKDDIVYSTKLAREQWLCMEIPPNRTDTTQRVFVRAKSLENHILKMDIDAPISVEIIKNPTPSQRRYYPDSGASHDAGNIKLAEHEKKLAEKKASQKESKSQDAQPNGA